MRISVRSRLNYGRSSTQASDFSQTCSLPHEPHLTLLPWNVVSRKDSCDNSMPWHYIACQRAFRYYFSHCNAPEWRAPTRPASTGTLNHIEIGGLQIQAGLKLGEYYCRICSPFSRNNPRLLERTVTGTCTPQGLRDLWVCCGASSCGTDVLNGSSRRTRRSAITARAATCVVDPPVICLKAQAYVGKLRGSLLGRCRLERAECVQEPETAGCAHRLGRIRCDIFL